MKRNVNQRLRLNRLNAHGVITNVNKKPTVIVTHEDIAHFLLADKSKRTMEETGVIEVMSKNLMAVKPNMARLYRES